jgi:hypothetical protein
VAWRWRLELRLGALVGVGVQPASLTKISIKLRGMYAPQSSVLSSPVVLHRSRGLPISDGFQCARDSSSGNDDEAEHSDTSLILHLLLCGPTTSIVVWLPHSHGARPYPSVLLLQQAPTLRHDGNDLLIVVPFSVGEVDDSEAPVIPFPFLPSRPSPLSLCPFLHTAGVGDSPEGPLKTGGTLLKTCKKQKRNAPLS